MSRSLNLLDQIIEMAEAQEKELKAAYLATHRGSLTVGEGALLHYLKVLKALIEEEQKGIPSNTVKLDGKELQVSYGVPPFVPP